MKRLFYLLVSIAITLVLLALFFKPWKHQLTTAAIILSLLCMAMYFIYLLRTGKRIDRS